MTKIEWTERVWNPVTGCTKVSEACRHCYAETMARRLQRMPASKEKYRNGFKVTLHEDALNEPYGWKEGMVFVVSMGDLFHEDVPEEFLDRVMKVIRENAQLTFQLLTKRAERMRRYFETREVPRNAWVGVTCESSKHFDRIDELRKIKANVRFLSCEPVLSVMCPDLRGIHWVIMGGESGLGARETPVEWFRTLRDSARAQMTPLFFKQWGAWKDGKKSSKYKNGAILDGEEIKEYPQRRIS